MGMVKKEGVYPRWVDLTKENEAACGGIAVDVESGGIESGVRELILEKVAGDGTVSTMTLTEDEALDVWRFIDGNQGLDEVEFSWRMEKMEPGPLQPMPQIVYVPQDPALDLIAREIFSRCPEEIVEGGAGNTVISIIRKHYPEPKK